MKYFAKYLPVEGEIKKGMKYRIGKSLGLGAYIEGYIGTAAIDFKPDAQKDQQAKIIKLFLCSRDIQVGDKLIKDGVEYEAHSRPDGVPFIGYYNKDWCYIDNDCFKVIGEISPDATWVKEGMEYDEKDFYMEKELDVSDNLYETGIVKIKGPCGHYH